MTSTIVLWAIGGIAIIRMVAVGLATLRESSRSGFARGGLRRVLAIALGAMLGATIFLVGVTLLKPAMPLLNLAAGFCLVLGLQIALWSSGVTSPILATDVAPPGTAPDVGVVDTSWGDTTPQWSRTRISADRSNQPPRLSAPRDLPTDWTEAVYVDFVERNIEQWRVIASGLLNHSASNAADRSARTAYRLVLPEPNEIADRLVAHLCHVLSRDSACYAVWTAHAWTRFPHLRGAQAHAIERGVMVREIILIGKQPEPQEALEALSLHRYHAATRLAQSSGEGRYLDLRQERELLTQRVIVESPLWIFAPRNEPSLVVHAAPGFSELRLEGAAEARELANKFKELWTFASPDAMSSENGPPVA